MIKLNQTTIYKEQRTWFFVALGLLVLAVSLYIYFLSASVVHVVLRKEIDQEISVVGSQVSQLESKYITLQHEVSAEIASLQGYVRADHKVFIDRDDTSVVVVRN